MRMFLFYVILLICGCSTPSGHYEYTRDTSKSIVSKKTYTISINDFENYYGLSIYNKSDEDIEIDWNRTSFIKNGRLDGNFMFEGIRYIDRNNQKNPTIIMSKSSSIIYIFPNNLVYFASGRFGGWSHKRIPDGENGVYLVFKQGSKEYREKLLIKRITTYVRDDK